jgi:hypothetical protein
MVQKSFGRRSPAREAAVAAAPAPHSGSTSGRSVAILGGVTGLVVVTALGLTLAFNAVANTASDIETTAQADVVVQDTLAQEARCRGQSGCTSQYDVKLSCGSSEELRSISVHAADAEAAQAKAERYNRDCRARGASFVAVFMRSGAGSGVRVSPAAAAPTRVADNGAGGRRSRLRFRRR